MKSRKSQRKAEKTRRKYLWSVGSLFAVLALSLIAYGKGVFSRPAPAAESGQTSVIGAVKFVDARQQAAEFISYDDAIVLNPEQKQVMHEALSSIPAPCCSEYSIETCCCPCNLAKSTWGLSKSLIAKQHASAAEVKAAAVAWLQFTNPEGYSGHVCADKGCNRAFEDNGCGGMDSRHIQ